MRATSAIESGQCGFTLLELMVVLAILVMGSVLLPMAFDRMMPGRRVTVSGQRIVAAIRDAEAESQASGRPLRLQLQEEGIVWGEHSKTIALPARTSVTATDPNGRTTRQIVVFPDGSARATRFDIRDGIHHGAVVVSGITGHAVVVASSQ